MTERPRERSRSDRRGTGFRPILDRFEDRLLLATFTVTRSDDGGSVPGSLTLRQAIDAANANSGADTIAFAIPANDPGHLFYRDDGVPGRVSRASIATTTATNDAAIAGIDPDWAHSWWSIRPTTPLSAIVGPTTIDGYSQSGSARNSLAGGEDAILRIELNGGASLSGSGVVINQGGAASSVSGLAINGFSPASGQGTSRFGIDVTGSDGNRIVGNYIGTDVSGTLAIANGGNGNGGGVLVNGSSNVLGGSAPADRNLIAGNASVGVFVPSATSTLNTIQGNFIGVDATGGRTLSTGDNGVFLANGASRNLVGGTGAGEGNVISGTGDANTSGSGILIESNSSNNAVQGNRIGTNAAGGPIVGLGNVSNGVLIQGASDNTIGGTAGLARNIISGNGSTGVVIRDVQFGGPILLAERNRVVGNSIGTDLRGTSPVPNASAGVSLSASHNAIGGSGPGEGNIIAFNGAEGIFVFSGAGNSILSNSIFSNDALGIALRAGANDDQLAPILSAAANSGGQSRFQGVLPATAAGPYTVQFFASAAADPSGLGEGQIFLGAITVTARVPGNTAFDATLPAAIPAGSVVTATATNPAGSTSAFSAAISAGTTVINTNDSGRGSLRQAILNANAGPGLNTITFAIPGAGVHTIRPASPLPTITDPVVIDGATEPGYAGLPLVELDGTLAGPTASGLVIGADGSTVRGLAINRFGRDGIDLLGDANVIQANFLGTDVNGTIDLGNGGVGVYVLNGASNLIGGLPGEGNLISANAGDGVDVVGSIRTGIASNRIGTDLSGTSALANGVNGVSLIDSTLSGVIGNVLSGNAGSGLALIRSSGTGVLANLVGTDPTGTQSLGNGGVGILLVDAPANLLQSNLVSANAGDGMDLMGARSTGNRIEGNRVGTDVSGTFALGNGVNGICVIGAPGNTIGGAPGFGTFSASPNLISGNTNVGVAIVGGATGTLVVSNLIGLDASGTSALPNGGGGLVVLGSSGNTIGVPGQGNVISGNGNVGIELGGPGNLVQGNYLGTDLGGTSAVGNRGPGVFLDGRIDGVVDNQVGPGNVISGNGFSNGDGGNELPGVWVLGPGAARTRIVGNIVGLDATGSTPLGNANIGVLISDSAGNVVGGPAPGDGNVIGGNRLAGPLASADADPATTGAGGVVIIGPGASGNSILGNNLGGNDFDGVTIAGAPGNVVAGNQIVGNGLVGGSGVRIAGLGASGNRVAGNRIADNLGDGVFLNLAPANLIGGTSPADRNQISGNRGSGVQVLGAGASGNVVAGNAIGTDLGGTLPLPNAFDGVFLNGAPGNTIGGTSAGAANQISANGYSGVEVRGQGASGNSVQGNVIGSAPGGPATLGNRFYGVLVDGASNTTIGGTAPGEANVLTNNGADGVRVIGGGGGGSNAIADNQISGNGIGSPSTASESALPSGQAGRRRFPSYLSARQGRIAPGSRIGGRLRPLA